ncbi:glutamine amidotransferase subunit PdxT [Batrachochytrium salamandrivorans]|nr:glutamine amidotransferase subunit PdxT [Batrachochytrium salamandrivorans]
MNQWVDMAIPIRTKEQLENSCLDALILPGGESTAIALAAERNGLMEPLRQWGTCAGMILLSDTAQGTKEGGQELIGGLHVQVKRNAFGHQLDSFVECIDIPVIGDTPFQAVFIRAPLISSICVDEMAKHIRLLLCRYLLEFLQRIIVLSLFSKAIFLLHRSS